MSKISEELNTNISHIETDPCVVLVAALFVWI